MSNSSTQSDEVPADAIARIAGRMLGQDVASFAPVGGGRNSRVYRLVAADRRSYALKTYFRRTDNRSCLDAEFGALQFLWQNGIRNIPEPLAVDREAQCALFEYVEGRKPAREDISASDIDAAVAFLGRLNDLRDRPGSQDLPPAAEACFSGEALVANLQARLDRLSVVRDAEATIPEFPKFISQEFLPTFDRIVRWSRSRFDGERELPQSQRILSPSDFGFHNALRRETAQWVFLDFEYFGWDDPAKTLSDFLLHPAMELTPSLKRRFADGLMGTFGCYTYLADRLIYSYPLFGLKWCLILLNEFLPEHFLRRQFAATLSGDRFEVQAVQLAKARHKLQQVCSEYEQFPYFG